MSSGSTFNSTTSDSINYVSEPTTSVHSVLGELAEVIAPVWPLKDYVAVNPFFGIASKNFLQARSFLRLFSDSELLLPVQHYANSYRNGELSAHDIAAAIEEIQWPAGVKVLTSNDVIESLLESNESKISNDVTSSLNHLRQVKTVAELFSSNGTDWLELIQDEITKHCSAYFDEGLASWEYPWKHMSLYHAWRTSASRDANLEIAGIKGVRKLIAQLPEQPEDAVAWLLNRLEVPQSSWLAILLSEAYSILGWCSWAKYQDDYAKAGSNNLSTIIAMRLAYDVAISESTNCKIDWSSFQLDRPIRVSTDAQATEENIWLRYTLLVASEIRYRNRLIGQIVSKTPSIHTANTRPSSQMIFCIDVRSERMRRHVEAVGGEIETFGFAGFFGLPLEVKGADEVSRTRQLPVLLNPSIHASEQLIGDDPHETQSITEKSRAGRAWKSFWHSFQTSCVGSFACVETTGFWGGVKLLKNSASLVQRGFNRLFGSAASKTQLNLLDASGCNCEIHTFSSEQNVLMVEKVLRSLNLTQQLARLVVFCGHASQTENNPLAASLNCGACGGHSGEPNARLITQLLNRPEIRRSLGERGIQLPQDTFFVGAVHDTTTEQISLLDIDTVPATHQQDLERLQAELIQATQLARTERLKDQPSASMAKLLRRAQDWSEVRPEWGLAGNAAMIVAPRHMTLNMQGDARVFLHSYDEDNDADASILETIMTAPMIVANWINMQYYASAVDNRLYGSGSKTIHNVVGRFGVLSGGGGDLKIGLPLQSLHTGAKLQHEPLRLAVFIAASKERIESIIRKHEVVENLATCGWLTILSIQPDGVEQFQSLGNWRVQ